MSVFVGSDDYSQSMSSLRIQVNRLGTVRRINSPLYCVSCHS